MLTDPTGHRAFVRRALMAPIFAVVLAGGSLAVVSTALAAGPTDDTLPSITTVQMAEAEIGPGDRVAAVVNGRFTPAPLGSQPTVSVTGDATVTFAVLAWDNDQIFGTLVTTASTPRGQKTLKVDQLVSGTATAASKSNAFRVGFTPVISGVAPATLVADTGGTLTVSGTKFEAGATVTLSRSGETNVSPTTTSVAADGLTITAQFAADAERRLGTWTLTVANPSAGTSATFTTLSVTGAAAPSVSTVSVDEIGQGISGVGVVVTGSGFYKGAAVAYSGSGLTVSSLTRVSSTQLQFNLAANDSAATGAQSLTVTNGDGQQTTVANAIEVFVRPQVTDGQVFTIPEGARRRVIEVLGSGFRLDTAISFFDGAGAPTVELSVYRATLTPGGIRIEVNATEAAPIDQRLGVRFLNPGGAQDGCEATSGQRGCIDVTPGPHATDVQPDTLATGDAMNLVVTGERFLVAGQSGAAFPFVVFSGAGIHVVGPVSYTPTALTVPVEVDTDAATGLRDVTVVNPDGGRGTCGGCLELTAGP